MRLIEIGDHIWVYEGSTVNFYGLPYSTRMTVIKLNNGDLWIHSPEKLNQELTKELNNLGRVAYLISPNKLHHLFLTEWVSEYPDVKCYASPGLEKKRCDIKFTNQLSDTPEEEWSGEIEQTVFTGSRLMEEVVFFHVTTRTLILTDLIENFNPSSFNWWQKPIARLGGILAPDGKTPIDWRLSFIFGNKKEAIISLNKILSWKPENVIISHGEYVIGNGYEFIKKSFRWLQKNT